MAGLSGESSSGVIEKAVRAHNPTQTVLHEAIVLDKELLEEKPHFQTLLPKVAAFTNNFASLLLHEQDALKSLGDVCLLGCGAASSASERTECAKVLTNLMLKLCREIKREGIDRIRRDVPMHFARVLDGMDESFSNKDHDADRLPLLESLLELGQQVIIMAEEAESPQAWFHVLCSMDRLLISLFRENLLLEHSRESGSDASGPNDTSKDLKWLDELHKRLEGEDTSCSETFMDLACFEKRNHDD